MVGGGFDLAAHAPGLGLFAALTSATAIGWARLVCVEARRTSRMRDLTTIAGFFFAASLAWRSTPWLRFLDVVGLFVSRALGGCDHPRRSPCIRRRCLAWLFQLPTPPDLTVAVGHLVVIVFVAGLLICVVAGGSVRTERKLVVARTRIGRTESTMILGAVNILFAVFAVAQFVAIVSGDRYVLQTSVCCGEWTQSCRSARPPRPRFAQSARLLDRDGLSCVLSS